MVSGRRVERQQHIRETIYSAAIDLFASKGFDETTTEEVAKAAGVSRRSFFRYFPTKNDLLAESVRSYGAVLAEAIEAGSSNADALSVIRNAVRAGAEHTSSPETRTREVVQIAAASALARQAHGSRMMDIENVLAQAFATRFQKSSPNEVQPRLLAGLTLTIMSATILSWFNGDAEDLFLSSEHIFKVLTKTLCRPRMPHASKPKKRPSESSPKDQTRHRPRQKATATKQTSSSR